MLDGFVGIPKVVDPSSQTSSGDPVALRHGQPNEDFVCWRFSVPNLESTGELQCRYSSPVCDLHAARSAAAVEGQALPDLCKVAAGVCRVGPGLVGIAFQAVPQVGKVRAAYQLEPLEDLALPCPRAPAHVSNLSVATWFGNCLGDREDWLLAGLNESQTRRPVHERRP